MGVGKQESEHSEQLKSCFKQIWTLLYGRMKLLKALCGKLHGKTHVSGSFSLLQHGVVQNRVKLEGAKEEEQAVQAALVSQETVCVT